MEALEFCRSFWYERERKKHQCIVLEPLKEMLLPNIVCLHHRIPNDMRVGGKKILGHFLPPGSSSSRAPAHDVCKQPARINNVSFREFAFSSPSMMAMPLAPPQGGKSPGLSHFVVLACITRDAQMTTWLKEVAPLATQPAAAAQAPAHKK